MLVFIICNEFSGQIVMWVPNPQTEYSGALRARQRAQIGRTLKWAALLWQQGILYGSALSSSSVVEQKQHGSHLPIDSRDPPPRHDALSCRGGVGGGDRCGACLPAFKLRLHNEIRRVMMMICRCDEGLVYQHHGTNSMSPSKELCFLHV
jgi:hypothetical protein